MCACVRVCLCAPVHTMPCYILCCNYWKVWAFMRISDKIVEIFEAFALLAKAIASVDAKQSDRIELNRVCTLCARCSLLILFCFHLYQFSGQPWNKQRICRSQQPIEMNILASVVVEVGHFRNQYKIRFVIFGFWWTLFIQSIDNISIQFELNTLNNIHKIY